MEAKLRYEHAGMMSRPAVHSDVDMLVGMIVDVTSKNYKLIPDRARIRSVVVQAIASKMHFVHVITENGMIKGCLLAGSGHFDFAKKMLVHISFFDFSSLEQGRKLASELLNWARARRAVQLIEYCVPYFTFGIDVLEEAGFKSTGSMTYWRRQWESSQTSGKA